MEEDIKKDESVEAKPEVSELEECNKKCDEYLNNWKRAAADMANYKKEEMARAGMLIGYAKEDVFSNLLPIIDSIYLAQTAFGKDGFMPVQKQIEDFLKKEGIEEIKAVGEKFNPETMETVGEAEGGEAGTIMEELQKGYKMNEKILRPTRVKISE